MTVSYTGSKGEKYREKIEINPTGLSCNYLNKMVDNVNLKALESALKYKESQEDYVFMAKDISTDDLMREIVKMSVEKQILTDLTAFICVDQTVESEDRP